MKALLDECSTTRHGVITSKPCLLQSYCINLYLLISTQPQFGWPGFCLPLERMRIFPFCNNDQIKITLFVAIASGPGGVSQAQGRCVSPAFWTTYL